ncbi:MAG: BamA/TamA family outer membrane protein [Desulfobacteraceae bacterium]|nr:BamA/TamA family outer membrane protein [Desulfobacteraceae bacterium]MBC2755346.1 BamA/TamA family outer membrane protein [Desulfobacteraceae bacterium]
MQRNNILKVLLLPAFVFLFFTGAALSAETENLRFKVRHVDFVGINLIKENKLAQSLSVQAPPFWKFWESHPVVSKQDVEEDVLRIKQHYQSQGYYQATVEYFLTPVKPENKPPRGKDSGISPKQASNSSKDIENEIVPEYDVTFKIVKGDPVIIRDIAINCLCEIEAIKEEQLREQFTIKTGRIFVTADYEESKINIKKSLGDKAYPFAKVTGRAMVDLNNNMADITFDIDPGLLYYFGDIRISGHEEFVREKVIRRAVTFKGGERYSDKELDKSRRNLFDLSIFKTAVIRTGDPNTDNQTVPIEVQVKPRKKQSVKLGVGYGTDDGLRLQTSWSYRNLTGRADIFSLRAKHSDIEENLRAEYKLPYFLSVRNNLITIVEYKREQEDYYTLQQLRSDINIYRKLKRNWFAAIGYNLEMNRPKDINIEDLDGILDPRDTEDYLVSSVRFNIQHNTIDDVLNARQGSAVIFSFEKASGALGSEIAYNRPGIEAKAFIPIPWGCVLSGRAEFRTMEETEDTDYIPISKQFFLGGSKSVRGYEYEKLGVIDENDVLVDISGLSSFLCNVELRYPIYKKLSGVVFLDMGFLGLDSYTFDLKNLRYTSGLGLRINTIIGPIQLDWGYKLNPAKSTASDDPILIDFFETDRWYIHFNIGQAF